MIVSNKDKIFWLEIVRAMAIIMVVMLHISALGIYRLNPAKAWWINNVFDSLTRPGVPLFLMVSGALLLDGSKYAGIGDFFRRRFNKLFIPLFGWSLFYLYISGGMASITLKTCYMPFLTILSRPTYGHLAFLYYLIGLYLIVPILQKFVSSAKHSDYIYYLSAWFVFNSLAPELGFFTNYSFGFVPVFLVNYSGYFVAGYYFAHYFPSGNDWKWSCNWILAVSWLGCLCFTIFSTSVLARNSGALNEHYYEYSSFNVVISSFCIFILCKQIFANCELPAYIRKVIMCVSSAAFGIYLVHPAFLMYLHVPAIVMNLSGALIIMVPLLTIAILLASMACIWISGLVPFLRPFWGMAYMRSAKKQSPSSIAPMHPQTIGDSPNKLYKSAA
jgi:surface polysaccharide O-acyltransferase-like enzyme